MNTPELAGVVAAWAVIQLALALFFTVVHALRREVEYRVFAAFCVAMAVTSAGLAGVYGAQSIGGWRFSADIALGGAIAAAAFNLDFVSRFTWPRRRHRFLVPVYLATLVMVLLVVSGHFRLAGSERVDATPLFGIVVRHVSSTFPWYAKSLVWVVAGELFIAVAILVRAQLEGRRDALALVAGGAVLSVATVSDIGLLFRWWPHGVYLLPHAFVFYGFAIGVALVSRHRDTAGRLEATRHSLEQRTEELQRSYADLRVMEGELFRREQLAAVGELAATIAHEVRNPLAIILNATAGLRRSGLGDEDRGMLLGIVEEEVGRLNRLVADLLRFARPVSVSWSEVHLRELVERIRGLAPAGIRVEVDVPEDSRHETISVDPGLLRLVLENLVENACQAMPDGGQITIVVRPDLLEEGDATSIEVRDTGRGMDARTLERALKPFFSTRPQGTGLGLAIVDRIVRAHGGTVVLTSELGQGTSVKLVIPLDEEVRRRRRSGAYVTKTTAGR